MNDDNLALLTLELTMVGARLLCANTTATGQDSPKTARLVHAIPVTGHTTTNCPLRPLSLALERNYCYHSSLVGECACFLSIRPKSDIARYDSGDKV